MMMTMLMGGLFWKTGNRNRLRAGVIRVQAVRRDACGLAWESAATCVVCEVFRSCVRSVVVFNVPGRTNSSMRGSTGLPLLLSCIPCVLLIGLLTLASQYLYRDTTTLRTKLHYEYNYTTNTHALSY